MNDPREVRTLRRLLLIDLLNDLLIDLLNDVASYAMRNRRNSLYDEYGTGKEDAIRFMEELLEEHLKEYPE
jgi:hypothetical protein